MKLRKAKLKILKISLLIIIVVSLASNSLVFTGKASPSSAYYYKFTVNQEGFTNVEINFSSTDVSGESWVFVPRLSSWNHTEIRGKIVSSEVVETQEVPGVNQSYYFYQVFRFNYQANGFFNMTLRFTLENGALIMEPRGIFYSPQIGFKSDSDGKAEVLLHHSFKVNEDKAVVIGREANYNVTEVELNRALFNLSENIVRLQIEFEIEFATPSYVLLKSSDNKTFTFKTLTRYQTYADTVLKVFDRIYNNLTRLFNITLENVAVQFFLPEFYTFLAVGGFVPYTGGQLGEININIAFIRAVNGTVEVIATHELVHRFLGKAGISPSNFLWFHEGMAQYLSVMFVSNLGYEGAEQEKNNLEDGVTVLIQEPSGENFSRLRLQYWSPSYQPLGVDIGSLYVASYYVVSRLPEAVRQDGLDYYGRFFKLIRGAKVSNISVLSLYLSMANNASVATTLTRWGFKLVNLYKSPVQELIDETGRAIEGTNPVFQPYRAIAEYFYQQALLSSERSDWNSAQNLLQLAITTANLAPLLTFLTILALVTLLVFIIVKLSKRPKPTVPPLPPEILQPTA